jgi:hypothetical protein
MLMPARVPGARTPSSPDEQKRDLAIVSMSNLELLSAVGAPNRQQAGSLVKQQAQSPVKRRHRQHPLSAPLGRAGLCALAAIGMLIICTLASGTATATTYPVTAGYGIELSVRPDAIRVGQPVTFTGMVSPAYAGGRVRLQRWVGWWRLIGVDRDIAPNGQFSITHVFGAPSYHGPTWLRICFRASAPRRTRICSASFPVRIKRAVRRRHHAHRRAVARARHDRHQQQLEAARRHRQKRHQRVARERAAKRKQRLEEARRRKEQHHQQTRARQEELRRQHQIERRQREEARKHHKEQRHARSREHEA